MASWASIAAKVGGRSEPAEINWAEEQPRVAVVDANAIISGLSLGGFADRAVTIQCAREVTRLHSAPWQPFSTHIFVHLLALDSLTFAYAYMQDVLEEIRDRKSRNFLQALPYRLDVLEPSAESVKTVTSFARMTGDFRSLSQADVRLIALAHDLELRTYGDAHLRSEPARTLPKSRGKGAPLPGWGTQTDAWAAIDSFEGTGTNGGGSTRIALAGGHPIDAVVGYSPEASDAEQPGTDPEASLPFSVSHHRSRGLSLKTLCMAEEDGVDIATSCHEGSEDDWEVAAKSKAARRHRVQKQARRERRVEDSRMEAGGVAGADDVTQTDIDDQNCDDQSIEQPDEASEAESCISSVTADFAMQNVLLQIGLRLVTPDGRRVKKIHTWILRCSACRSITQEVSRLFCPQCGNATLDRVEITIGPNGEEMYGVRKKHNLRGTKYSLPKPKGGKKCHDPILREDVMMQKSHRRK
eukprot:scaffold142716_cov52-Prasinocladus_malaysianus.AAC.1